MPVALLVIGGIVLLTVVSGVYVFLIGFVRKRDVHWLVESEIRKTPFGKYCQHVADADHWIREHKSYKISIQSHEGLKLQGLWIPVENARGTMLLVHGYRSNYLVDFGPALSYYHRIGMNMLIPVQRAHGESEGALITFGVKESMDVYRWIQYHNRMFGEYPMVLSGLSMGASTVVYSLEYDMPLNVKGVIADCGFTSPAAILKTIFRRITHLPAFPTLIITDILARFFAGISIWGCNTKSTIGKSTIPILMIHGTEDDFVPCEMTEQAFSVSGGCNQILLVDGAKHGESFLTEPERYVETVRSFIDRCLSNE